MIDPILLLLLLAFVLTIHFDTTTFVTLFVCLIFFADTSQLQGKNEIIFYGLIMICSAITAAALLFFKATEYRVKHSN